MRRVSHGLLVGAAAVALAAGMASGSASAGDPVEEGIARADCGPGSSPETGLQGQVPAADRRSDRSSQGYSCNLELLGQYQGKGAGIVNPTYEHCAYMSSFNSGILQGSRSGVRVIDASDPTAPQHTATLASTAFKNSTWESLKVSSERGLLVGVGAQLIPGVGLGAIDVWDVSQDCAVPTLLNGTGRGQSTKFAPVVAHEGQFAPDGRTYYSTIAYAGLLTATSLDDPANPKVVFTGAAGLTNHGMSFSDDGRIMYGVTAVPAGLQIIDVSDIQDRKPRPRLRLISQLQWGDDGLFSQMTIPFTSDGHPYVFVVDEAGNGGVRLVDLADITKPKVVRKYRLEIGRAENVRARQADVGGDGLFGYEAHYCTLDRPVDPTALACGYFQSGLRVFDIRDVMDPKEIAYYNPPAQKGKTLLDLPNSFHAVGVLGPPALSFQSLSLQSLADSVLRVGMTADWCTSPPEFKNGDQLWATCGDNGFMALRFTNDAYPLER